MAGGSASIGRRPAAHKAGWAVTWRDRPRLIVVLVLIGVPVAIYRDGVRSAVNRETGWALILGLLTLGAILWAGAADGQADSDRSRPERLSWPDRTAFVRVTASKATHLLVRGRVQTLCGRRTTPRTPLRTIYTAQEMFDTLQEACVECRSTWHDPTAADILGVDEDDILDLDDDDILDADDD